MSTSEAYFNFANNMTNGEFNNFNSKEKLKYIFDTEEGIYVPEDKMNDYLWLYNNFGKLNKKHPMFEIVMNILNNIIVSESVYKEK